MQSASGWSQLEKRAKEAEGARSGMTRRSSWEGSMLGDARMQLLKPCEQACMGACQHVNPGKHLKGAQDACLSAAAQQDHH